MRTLKQFPRLDVFLPFEGTLALSMLLHLTLNGLFNCKARAHVYAILMPGGGF
jgi:hypothetical protein